jgi:hypothetical protein
MLSICSSKSKATEFELGSCLTNDILRVSSSSISILLHVYVNESKVYSGNSAQVILLKNPSLAALKGREQIEQQEGHSLHTPTIPTKSRYWLVEQIGKQSPP